MYYYIWDVETGGLLLTNDKLKFSKEPRPVYYRELDILGFDKYWSYPKNDDAPIMWAEANNYIYRGRTIAKTKGGSLYTPPELIVVDDSDCGDALVAVDIQKMVEKNRELMQVLSQDTIKQVYREYCKYRNKVDIFHVSFSGGKDSVVNLDIVQRAIPHDEFVVIFGNTGMEFPDTLEAVERAKLSCESKGIRFFIAKSEVDALENWRRFGPPSNTIRWCCSVHKTTPQLLLLREIVGKSDLVEMAFVGVRREESVKRSGYEYTSYGKKHKGQYSCNPILDWGSAEVYLYIYEHDLILNEAYKKGNSRAGCLVCPMACDRHEYMRNRCYPDEVAKYIQVIRECDGRGFASKEEADHFIDIGGWKKRSNGRDLAGMSIRYKEKASNTIEVVGPTQKWTEWLKTLGRFVFDGHKCTLQRAGETHSFGVVDDGEKLTVSLSEVLVRNSPTTSKLIKQVFRKAAYCLECGECQADCPHGCLKFVDGRVVIADDCRHCLNCHKPSGGCLVYQSLEQPKGLGTMKSTTIDCYADHAPKYEWIQSFFEKQDAFLENHDLGSTMFDFFKRFLRDAGLLEKNKLTETARVLKRLGLNSPSCWAIMLVNLSHTPEVGWYVKHMPFDTPIKKEYLINMLKDDGAKDRASKSVPGAYKRILSLPFGSELGLGEIENVGRSFSMIRGHWLNPVSEVILYSLYKFAEACGGYYQFSLKTLYDETIEREGVSPTQIFGIDRKSMVGILNGLSANYPDFISASFTLDLENITLREDKSSRDVLGLL